MSGVDELGYGDDGQYVGPCPKCGTNHRATCAPGTLQGDFECIRARIVAEDPGHPVIVAMDAQWDQAQASMRDAMFRVLRDMA